MRALAGFECLLKVVMNQKVSHLLPDLPGIHSVPCHHNETFTENAQGQHKHRNDDEIKKIPAEDKFREKIVEERPVHEDPLILDKRIFADSSTVIRFAAQRVDIFERIDAFEKFDGLALLDQWRG